MATKCKLKSLTVSTIRDQFGAPVSVHSKNEGNYCVLGAVFKYARNYFPDALVKAAEATGSCTPSKLDSLVSTFPGSGESSRLLSQFNPKLGEDARTFAREVLELNDAGKFAAAWKKLSEAFLFEPKPEVCK